MADQMAQLKERVCWLLECGGAHRDFRSIVDEIPPQLRGRRLAGTDYTPWRLLEHMRRAQNDLLEYTRDPTYESPPYEEFWPDEDAPPSDNAWTDSVERFAADNEAFRQLAAAPDTDLFADPAHTGKGHTALRQALIAADHNAYHLGELYALCQALPKD